jgi:hypothetical protein
MILSSLTLPPLQNTMASLDYTRGYLLGITGKDSDHMTNAMSIDVGLFFHIPVWETPQTLLGNIIAHYRNIIGRVDNVEIDTDRFSVLVNDNDPNNPDDGWGFTLGPYINSKNIDVRDDIYYHENGHVIQSRIFGPLYFPNIAIPSGISAYYSYYMVKDGGKFHNGRWYERWADELGRGSRTEHFFGKPGLDHWVHWTSLILYPLVPNY